ncbi:unnamed protein product [marine sediment metagenome]|uniref:Uncharacterized protein n=1 Tax=marine sediment metagenome TaxID=412755 RepID=X1MM80_9ZZZZ
MKKFVDPKNSLGITSRKGRVVYTRKKHEMGLRDVVRMLERLSINLNIEEMEKNPWMIHALYEIVRTAFYPIWLKAINPGIKKEQKTLKNLLFFFLSPEIIEKIRQILEQVAVEHYVPRYIINAWFRYLKTMWTNIIKMTDCLFACLSTSRQTNKQTKKRRKNG